MSTWLSQIFVAHLSIDIEVGPEVPLQIGGDILEVFRHRRHGGKRIGIILGILRSLLQQEGRGRSGFLRGSTGIEVFKLGLHGVGDVEIGLHAGGLLFPAIMFCNVAVGVVGEGGGIMRIAVITVLPHGSAIIGVRGGIIDGDGLVADGKFVVAASLLGGGIPMVLLHHRAVILAQGGHIGQRGTHDFPSVLVEQDDLRLQRRSLKRKRTRTAHVDGLEPVVLIQILLAATCSICHPPHPWCGIGESFVGMPVVGKML